MPPTVNLSDLKTNSAFRIEPVKFAWDMAPDGTQVAFTGFPFGARDPMTFRAGIAAYRPRWRDGKLIDEQMLDRSAWPGFSGSPVFLSDGRVAGILISGSMDEGIALTFLRPVSALREMLRSRVSTQ